jgi:hypothetical protein
MELVGMERFHLGWVIIIVWKRLLKWLVTWQRMFSGVMPSGAPFSLPNNA